MAVMVERTPQDYRPDWVTGATFRVLCWATAATLSAVLERLLMPEVAGMVLEPVDWIAWFAVSCSYIKLRVTTAR